MPIFMDRHDIPGVSAEDVAAAHQNDLYIQEEFDCRALTYWFDEEMGMAFCLIEAPDKEAVQNLHNNAHGLIPNQVIEVEPNLVASFLGRIEDPDNQGLSESGIINDPAFRSIMVIYINAVAFFDDGINIIDVKSKIRNELMRYIGREAITDKDFFLASFQSMDQSIRCALSIRHSFDSTSNSSDPKKKLLQIGLAAGVPVSGENDFFGPTVKLAKRLGLIAKPGHIITSAIVEERFADMTTDFYGSFKPNISTLNQKQEEFFNQVMEILEDLGCDSEFNVKVFSKKTGMSKSKLYRKITGLTGYSPNDLIKEFRLKMALRSIHRQKGNISEIAYESGFSSLSYFSRCFQERFGILPSTFASSLA